jgi:hypothetical protein
MKRKDEIKHLFDPGEDPDLHDFTYRCACEPRLESFPNGVRKIYHNSFNCKDLLDEAERIKNQVG